MTTIIYYFLVA